MSKGRKTVLIIIVIVIAFIIAATVIAPRLFDVNRYRPEVISLIEQNTGRHVEIGHLSLSIFPTVSIRADQFAIANPPGFPNENWLTIQRITARLDLGALWNRRIVIRRLDLSQPVLRLESNREGRWNYEITPPARSAAADPPSGSNTHNQSTPLFSLQEISKLVLKNGRLTVMNPSPDGSPGAPSVECQGVAASLENIDLAALGTPPVTTPASAGTAATGTLNIASLRSGNIEATKVESDVRFLKGQVQLNNLRFDFYEGKGKGTIVLDLSGPSMRYNAQTQLSGVDVAKLLDRFPSMRGAMTGKLEGHMTFSGVSAKSPDPWAGKQGQGVVTIRKGRWPKLQLNKNLLELAHVAQLGAASGDPSAFSSVAAQWQLAHDVMTTKSIRVVGTGITVDGSGTVDLTGPGQLHYEGVAEIEAHQNPLTNILANLSGATFQNGKLRLPFVVNGTLDKPLFQLKSNFRFNPPAAAKPGSPQNQAPQALQDLFKLLKPKKK